MWRGSLTVPLTPRQPPASVGTLWQRSATLGTNWLARSLLFITENERTTVMDTTVKKSQLQELLDTACGRISSTLSAQRSLHIAVGSLLCALLLAAGWGAAAGSSSLFLALSSGLKVPIIVLLSTLAALPATLLALRLSGVEYQGIRLILSICSGVLGGALILAALAPIVGIYYHTSAAIGAKLAVASAFVALGTGGLIMVRNALKQLPAGLSAKSIAMPLAVFVIVLLAAMLQFIALASPVLPAPSVFDGGIDGIIIR
tara:strand:+ start:53355 stop:54131 length:777 start_codon:yes stop_codon:yes gene_type:complete